MSVTKITDLTLKDCRVLMRLDLNVPIQNGVITNDARILAALPTIRYAMESGASVILASHFGRPQEGVFDNQFSLEPVANYLQTLLLQPVRLVRTYLEEKVVVEQNEIVLLENVRFNRGEKKNSESLARQLGSLCDVFVMDAFGAAHRAHASTCGVARFANKSCAGLLMEKELNSLSKAMEHPAKPLIAVVGGTKVSTKLTVIKNLANKCDQIIPGGGIANTFLAAAGYPVGKSLYEPELIDHAKDIMNRIEVSLPVDVIVAKTLSKNAETCLKSVTQVSEDDMILDIGSDSCMIYSRLLSGAQTVLWNGPVGVFEFDSFSAGTKALAEAISASKAFSIAGGGDTVAAVDKFGVRNGISYISTGGGAFLEYVEGKTLPAVAALEK